jgi:hypothetical protein
MCHGNTIDRRPFHNRMVIAQLFKNAHRLPAHWVKAAPLKGNEQIHIFWSIVKTQTKKEGS